MPGVTTPAEKIRKDLLPYKAGIARLTPLNDLGVPVRTDSYSTFRNFLVSTQMSETRTSQSVENGNGQDAEYPTGATFNVAIATNVFDPKWHAIVSSAKKAATAAPILFDTTVIPKVTETNAEYTFGEGELPVKAETSDKQVYLEIKDNFGNVFTDVSGAETALGDNNYKYDADSHKLSFDAKYDQANLNCVYYIEDKEAVTYESEATPKKAVYMLETMGEMQSAETGEIIRVYQKLARASASGDIPNVTTQKQIQNTITYNFKSEPVPIGVSPVTQTFSKVKTK